MMTLGAQITLDRQSPKRSDAAWVTAKLAEPAARIMVMVDLKPVVEQTGMGEAPDPNDPNLGSPGRHTSANTLIVHGDLDATVPLSDSIAWATPRDVPVVVVPGGEHFFHRKLHVLREIVARWVR